MALAQKRNTRRTTILMIVLAVAVIGGGVYYYLSTRTPSVSEEVTFTGAKGTDLPILTSFGEDLYAAPRFRALYNFLLNAPPPDLDPPSVESRNPNPFRVE